MDSMTAPDPYTSTTMHGSAPLNTDSAAAAAPHGEAFAATDAGPPAQAEAESSMADLPNPDLENQPSMHAAPSSIDLDAGGPSQPAGPNLSFAREATGHGQGEITTEASLWHEQGQADGEATEPGTAAARTAERAASGSADFTIGPARAVQTVQAEAAEQGASAGSEEAAGDAEAGLSEGQLTEASPTSDPSPPSTGWGRPPPHPELVGATPAASTPAPPPVITAERPVTSTVSTTVWQPASPTVAAAAELLGRGGVTGAAATAPVSPVSAAATVAPAPAPPPRVHQPASQQDESSSGAAGPVPDFLVRPAVIVRQVSPQRQNAAARRHNAALIFSPTGSPPSTPPDSPRPGETKPGAPAAAAAAGPKQRASTGRDRGQKPRLRALPPAAYRRRRGPVDELLSSYNMTSFLDKYLQDKREWEQQHPQHANNPQLVLDLNLAASKLQGVVAAAGIRGASDDDTGPSPSGRPQQQQRQQQRSRSDVRESAAAAAAAAFPAALALWGGSEAGDGPSPGVGEDNEDRWAGRDLLGTPQGSEIYRNSNFGAYQYPSSSEGNSRPGSATDGRHVRHQDSGDGRHQGMTGLSAYQGLAQHTQGAYLTFPEYSFGGSRPFKAAPERGVLFERYGHRADTASAVQQFYLRPDRSVLIGMQQATLQQQQAASQEQQQLGGLGGLGRPVTAEGTDGFAQQGGKGQRERSPPKILPNGIPISRLEQLRSVQESSRSRVTTAPHKHKRALAAQDPGGTPGGGDGSPGGVPGEVPPSKSFHAEASTILKTVQEPVPASTPPTAAVSLLDRGRSGRSQRIGAGASGSGTPTPQRHLASRPSLLRQTSLQAALPQELEDAAAAVVDMGLTAFATAPGTAEPMLDPHFFAAMKAHFNQLAEDQTLRLQGKLNTGLPTILHAFGVKHVNATVSGGTGRLTGRSPRG